MNKSNRAALAACIAFAALHGTANAQVAGATVVGVSETVIAQVAKGWSVKRNVLDKKVYNDEAKPAEVGVVTDIVVTPEGSVSYAIVDARKYLGLSNHNVAVPVAQLKLIDGRLVLAGATKDNLRAAPVFEYAK